MIYNEDKITALFPTVILERDINRHFTIEELMFFDELYKDSYTGYGNRTSKDHYVLNNPQMSTLKKEIEDAFEKYMREFLAIGKETEVNITQSWLNWASKGEGHHMHSHPNSFLSGVLYISVVKNDTITFDLGKQREIVIKPEKYNYYNSESWNFPVAKGKILIFPSTLNHGVSVHQQDGMRISLAFNMFPKGKYGVDMELTELVV